MYVHVHACCSQKAVCVEEVIFVLLCSYTTCRLDVHTISIYNIWCVHVHVATCTCTCTWKTVYIKKHTPTYFSLQPYLSSSLSPSPLSASYCQLEGRQKTYSHTLYMYYSLQLCLIPSPTSHLPVSCC